jgi:tetratricopeptide (TPR) repeat protein
MKCPRPWLTLEIPDEILAVPRMLSDEEARYLIWVTESQFTGCGAVVDLGPWLGGSSVALAEGLRRGGAPTPVHCFDLFEWRTAYMERSSPRGLKDGDDFMPVFLDATRSHADRIVAERMDLLAGRWDRGPIEILFVDAAKSWELWSAILRVFGPHLVPGRSRVIHQDFRHPWCHWLPLTIDSRPDVWRELESVAVGDTVTFVPETNLVAAGLTQSSYTEESFDLPTSRRVLERRIAEAETVRQRLRFRQALVFKAAVEGDLELAATVQATAILEIATLEPEGLRPGFESEVQRIRDSAVAELVAGALGETRPGDVEFADRCLGKLEGRPQAHMVRGIRAARRGDDSLAFEFLSRALDRDPSLTRAWFERADLALRKGDAAAVRDDVIAALGSRPDHPPGVQAFAFRLLEQALRKLDSACAARAVIAALDPTWAESAEWLVLRALIEHETEDRDASVRTIRRALELAPGHERAAKLLSEWRGAST